MVFFQSNLTFRGKVPNTCPWVSLYKATQMGKMFSLHLQCKWGQNIKASSKQRMVVKGDPDIATVYGTWQVCEAMTVLGHVIENDWSVVADFDFTVVKLWRSFWKNSGRITSSRCSHRYRIMLMRRTSLPIVDQHTPVRVPASSTGCSGKCCRLVPMPGDSVDEFVTCLPPAPFFGATRRHC